MSEISKEALAAACEEKVKRLEFSVKECAFDSVRRRLETELAIARVALAALRERAEPVVVPDLHKVVYHFRDLNEGFPVERFKADYVIAWMLANYPPAPPAPVVPDGLRIALSNAGIAAPESDEMLWASQQDYIQMLVTWVKDRKPFKPAPVVPEPVSQPYKLPEGWIACSEQLPEREYVLAADFSGAYYPPSLPNTQVGIYADWLEDGKPSWDDGDGNDLHLKQVTHWMPLPAAPGKEG
ncbi:hypothetical protein BN132_629 [Cronobacter turicensis 564]|nr:hypothetical protein BN132_629 [Cronobacter turicensis 564]